MLPLIMALVPFALGFDIKEGDLTETTPTPSGCEPLSQFQQDTATTKAGITIAEALKPAVCPSNKLQLFRFTPPMEEGLATTNFSCDPLPGHNMTMVTSFSSFFGGDPFLYVSPANSRWEISLKCNTEQRFWYHEELVEDILYHIKFYKIRCNSFLFTDIRQMDAITEELRGVPFP